MIKEPEFVCCLIVNITMKNTRNPERLRTIEPAVIFGRDFGKRKRGTTIN
jgi:hypothetical protein